MSIPMLETERLILRPFCLDDAKDVQRLAGDREVAATTLHVPHPYKDGMAEEWIGSHEPNFKSGRFVDFAMTLRQSGELAGAIGLVINQKMNRAELGYWVGVPYWGQGYCTEAARVVLEYGFTQCGLNRIHASHFGTNPASGRVLEKIGMTQEGIQPQHIRKWDEYQDYVIYGILKEDWSISPQLA